MYACELSAEIIIYLVITEVKTRRIVVIEIYRRIYIR